MTLSDGVIHLSKMFREFLPRLFSFFYYTKQLDFIFFVLLYCNRSRHCVRRTKSHDTRLRLVLCCNMYRHVCKTIRQT